MLHSMVAVAEETHTAEDIEVVDEDLHHTRAEYWEVIWKSHDTIEGHQACVDLPKKRRSSLMGWESGLRAWGICTHVHTLGVFE